MSATMKCPKCGLVQEWRVVFCNACRAVLVEPVVPGSIASMDPKLLTWSRQRIIGGLICLLVFARIAYSQKTPPEIAPKQIEEASSKRINEKGKAIAERLEAECNYEKINKNNSDGTVSVSKGIYGTWGRRDWAMFLPKSSWEALSSEEKRDLIDYVSRGWPDGRSVSHIIVGQVIPSPWVKNSNTITIDTIVWPYPISAP